MTIEQFIQTKIETVDNLRALLLLHSDPQTAWDAATASGRLFLSSEVASRVLEGLAAQGLLKVSRKRHYCYRRQTQAVTRLVEQLAQLDRERPVSLINLISARPENMQASAEKFRLRREGN